MQYLVTINAEHDVARAILQTRRCAEAAGFSGAAVSMLATVVSELARNIDVDRQACIALKPVFPDQSGKICGSTC